MRLRVNKKLGWVVVEVIPGGAGDVGGVKRGDIIVVRYTGTPEVHHPDVTACLELVCLIRTRGRARERD